MIYHTAQYGKPIDALYAAYGLGDFKIGGRQIHDANIVATMLAYDIPCLLTHNIKDFKRFGDLIRIEAIDDSI